MDDQGRARSPEPAREPVGLRFGVFEMDLRSGELRKSGVLLRLAPQPFQLLGLLARSHGEVLTREEIRHRIWDDGTFVDFDQRLNSCVNQVRQALGDDAETPRFIETLPKRGYRWLAATQELAAPALPGRPALHVVVPFGSRADAAPAQEAAAGAAPERAPARRGRVLRHAHAAVTLLASAAAAWLWTSRPATNAAATWHRVTFQRGMVGSARFGPTGEIVYRARWEDVGPESYVATLAGPDARRLELPPMYQLLGVSSHGELAYVRPDGGEMTLARVPMAGGAPRDVAKGVRLADWTPDGKDFAVVRGVNGRPRLEFPIGQDHGEVEWTTGLRVSPDGERVALLQHPTPGDDAGHVLVVERDGRRHRITTEWASLAGLAWGPGSDEVWFGGARTGSLLGVQAATLDGRERTILQTGTRTIVLDRDANGHALLDAGTSRIGVRYGAAGEPERELGWLDATSVIDMSADGKQVLLVESGDGGGRDYGIYLRPSDGAPPVRLGSGRATALSPDGAWVLAIPIRDPSQIELIPTGAGQRRILRYAGLARYARAVFAGDARHVLFTAIRAGSESGHTYLDDIEDDAPPRLLGEFQPGAVSRDGRKLVRSCAAGSCVLDIASGEETPLPLRETPLPLFWDGDGRHLFALAPKVGPRARIVRVDSVTGERSLWRELGPADPVGIQRLGDVMGTPDGRAYAYTYHRRLSELFVVDGLR